VGQLITAASKLSIIGKGFIYFLTGHRGCAKTTEILMKSHWSIGELRKGQLVRVVALLFLVHAGVDMLFPQLCSEEAVNVTMSQSSTVAKAASRKVSKAANIEASPQIVAAAPYDSEEREESTPRDEDCFCCCSHVMASPRFVNPDTSELKLPARSQLDIAIPSVPLNNPYHPPRFA
jgi:hypothetical protein